MTLSRVADESTASGTSGSAVTSSSVSKAGIAPLPIRNTNGNSAELAPPANPAAGLDSADGERLLKPPIKQLMPPPFRLPDLPIIDKASGLINGVGKLDLRGRTAEDNEKQPVQQQSSEDGLVMMTILPDEKGRFGFNVKGGADQKMPIIVSRVGVSTPADRYDILGRFLPAAKPSLQSGASGHSLGFVNKKLGSSPGLLGQ